MPLAYGIQSLYDNYIVKNHLDKQFRYATADVPILGDVMRAVDKWNYANDYMRNRNISWDSVKYPTRAFGSSGLGLYGAISPTVESVEKLYKEEDRKRERFKNEYSRNLRNEHYRTAIDANNMRRAWYYSRL